MRELLNDFLILLLVGEYYVRLYWAVLVFCLLVTLFAVLAIRYLAKRL